MIQIVKNWKEFLELNKKVKIDILAHLEGFDEDDKFIRLVEKNEDGTFAENKELMRILCEMMLDDHPELKNVSFKTLVETETFEITINE